MEKVNNKFISKAENLTKSLLKRNKSIIGSIFYSEKKRVRNDEIINKDSKDITGEDYEKWNKSGKLKEIKELFIISGFKGSDKDSIEHILAIQKDANSIPKNKDIKINCILLSELWNSATRGQTSVLSALTSGKIIYDDGNWIKSLLASELHKNRIVSKFEKYVVSYVIAGSLIRGEAHEYSDLDVSIIIDDSDVTKTTSGELKLKLRNIASNEARIAEKDSGLTKPIINVQVWILSEFWTGLKRAEPVFYTTLRDGVPIYDRGMFSPWKLMLQRGQLIPSPESIRRYIDDGKKYIDRMNMKVKSIATDDLFWSIVYPSQGILMLLGVPPGSPNQVANQINEHLVKSNLLDRKYYQTYVKINKLRKDLEYGKLKDVNNSKIVQLIDESIKYIEAINNLYDKIEIKIIRNKMSKLETRTKEDILSILKLSGISSKKSNAINSFKQEILEKGFARSNYLDLIDKLYNTDTKNISLSELDSLDFKLNELRNQTIDLINTKKSNISNTMFIKYKKNEVYYTAKIWLFSDKLFIIKDMNDSSSKLFSYDYNSKGKMTNEKESTMKILNNKIKNYDGISTLINVNTLKSLKNIFGDNIQLYIGN